uniref:Uncharacterized protein n=1 Tax=Onchocerca volvulus TaxID=6282 RepID=A0A8R1TX87_ONCVO
MIGKIIFLRYYSVVGILEHNMTQHVQESRLWMIQFLKNDNTLIFPRDFRDEQAMKSMFIVWRKDEPIVP